MIMYLLHIKMKFDIKKRRCVAANETVRLNTQRVRKPVSFSAVYISDGSEWACLSGTDSRVPYHKVALTTHGNFELVCDQSNNENNAIVSALESLLHATHRVSPERASECATIVTNRIMSMNPVQISNLVRDMRIDLMLSGPTDLARSMIIRIHSLYPRTPMSITSARRSISSVIMASAQHRELACFTVNVITRSITGGVFVNDVTAPTKGESAVIRRSRDRYDRMIRTRR